jgi:hypothetical protein
MPPQPDAPIVVTTAVDTAGTKEVAHDRNAAGVRGHDHRNSNEAT